MKRTIFAASAVVTPIHISEQNELAFFVETSSKMAQVNIQKMFKETGIHPHKIIRHLLNVVPYRGKWISPHDLRVSSLNATTLTLWDIGSIGPKSRISEEFKAQYKLDKETLPKLKKMYGTRNQRTTKLANAMDILHSVASTPTEVLYATKHALHFVQTIKEANRVYNLISENYQVAERYAIKYIANFFFSTAPKASA